MRGCTCAIGLTVLLSAEAQRSTGLGQIDTVYVKDYSHLIAGRLFSSTKFNTLGLGGRAEPALTYRPNNQINLGVGASYRKLTLNIGLKAPFINNDDDLYGKTRYIDAQANMLGPSRATNLFLQYFQGYHISSFDQRTVDWGQDTRQPYRPDLSELNIGISTLRMTNAERFSYRAAFNQDAWQRISQGSWMYGGYATYYHLHADSSLVPAQLADRYGPAARIRIGDFVDLGVMGGYAYTWVMGGHWFVTASAAAGIGGSLQRTVRDAHRDDEAGTSLGPGWHVQGRAGIGYNSARDQIGLTYNQERTAYFLPTQNVFAWSVGNVRLNYVHRFSERIAFLDKVVRLLKRGSPADEAVPATDQPAPRP